MTQNRVNSITYFLIYLATSAILIYINTYLPVLFLYILDINRVELAFMQLIAYTALLVKPAFALVSDNLAINKKKRKPYIILAACLLTFGFYALTLSITHLMIFTIFLSVSLFASALLDVSIKGLIADSSPSIENKNRKIFFTKIGAAFGAIFPNIIFLITMRDINLLSSWYLFFGLSSFFLIPLIIIVPFMKEIPLSSSNPQTQEAAPSMNNAWKSQRSFLFSLIAMCAFIFFLYGDKLFEYPLEAWIISKFGEDQFYFYSFFMIIGIFINMFGYVLGTYSLKNLDRKKILGIVAFICGIIEILFSFVDFFTFLILMGIIQIVAGILSINLVSLMMEFAKNNKIFYFQIIVAFFTFAVIIFVPLGTLLSAFIATEVIFIIAGSLLIASLIPLYFVKIPLSERVKEI